MDASVLTRRRLIQLAGIGVGASVAAACTANLPPVDPSSTAPVAAGTTTAPAAPLTVTTRTGEFVSAFRPGVTTRWSLATPGTDGGQQPSLLPMVVFLHGMGGSHSNLLDGLAADEFLQRHLDKGRPPFAIAAVDGGDTWWHARADGSDTQTMLVKEFVPFLGDQGYDLGRIGLFGISMGGFGALLLASQGKLPGLRAVAALSPAVWRRYDQRTDSAFDSPADFAAHDVFALRPRLAAVPKRIDCGTEDELFATVTDYVSALPGRVEGGFRPGGHDLAYWRSVLPDVFAFLGRHLG
ncbi:alpha/beta hydrolase family protein [Arthrobacter sp. ISL-28]|uniref:alpha/beta hydrolase n=1 Tax=Arthrobacter sp. ISL-28 TaxID=2819108 RepID=UPI001BE77CA3|nr:alpha/beta hydrolase-fold protein [Arthrobacter sp. ISL-28]MBT2523123.1 esterase [Arthrobacter sp. ISL-28]